MNEDMSDDDWPFPFEEETSNALSSERIRDHVTSKADPLAGISETTDAWVIGDWIYISKRRAGYRAGWWSSLRAESCFRKQWFDFPDIDRRGWAIIFRLFEPKPGPGPRSEYFAGWVPPERDADADRWIAFLNSEIQARLAGLPSSNAKP